MGRYSRYATTLRRRWPAVKKRREGHGRRGKYEDKIKIDENIFVSDSREQGWKCAFSHFPMFELEHQRQTDGRTDGPVDRRTKSLTMYCVHGQTRPDTRLPQSRAGGQGQDTRSFGQEQ